MAFRTTTPNSLREALKETLAKNLVNNDLVETIQCIRDDEILDTFDNQRAVEGHGGARMKREDDLLPDDLRSEVSSLAGERRRRFRGEGGKPLGDRELVLKKKRSSTSELLGSGHQGPAGEVEEGEEEVEELGSGLFDRFSSARKTLTRGSFR